MADAISLSFKFTSINAVYWTLAIEFQFYLVMAVALALSGRAVQCLSAVTLVSLPLWYWGTWKLVGIFLPYWPMFAIGILLYLLLERGVSFRWLAGPGGGRSVFVTTGILVAVFIVAAIQGEPGELAFGLAFGLLLWCLHPLDEHYRKNLRSGGPNVRVGLQAWRQLGLMSYSLYLLHGRLQFLSSRLCRQVIDGIALDIGVIGLTCILCYFFYLYAERRFIRARVGVAATVSSPPQAAAA